MRVETQLGERRGGDGEVGDGKRVGELRPRLRGPFLLRDPREPGGLGNVALSGFPTLLPMEAVLGLL